MPWSSTSGNQGVTFANLKDAVDTSVLTARYPVPNTNEIITKDDAVNYVNIDTTVNTFAAKTGSQLIVKNDLVRLGSTTCVANCSIVVRNQSSSIKSISFYSPGGTYTCRGDYNWTNPDLAPGTQNSLTNNWEPGPMSITLTTTTTTPIVIDYSLDGGSTYTTIQTSTLQANVASLFNTVSVPNVPGYILRVTMYDTGQLALHDVYLDGSRPSGGGGNFMVTIKASNGTSAGIYGGGPIARFSTVTCTRDVTFGTNLPVEYWHLFAKPLSESSTFTALNPDSDVYEAYYNDGLNSCGQTGTLTSHYKKLRTSGITSISVQPRLSGGAYVLAPTYNLNVYSTAPVGTLVFEYTLIREGFTWSTTLRPFIRPTTSTCTFLGTIKLRPGDQIKMRLLFNGSLVNHIAALDSVDCPPSGTAFCETTIDMTSSRDVAFRPTLGNFGLDYAICL